uniref:Uncharacterized protein n=1 Tax=Chromera velia CCMP2878 TaxID=1169474 RepID=A0A0G4GAJ0_9ALVE|eukprot:Cvel_21011.t1-p1 / transcript=Cvel_21011.t1 / gene=Cvel_21011 / organism=Chromera_velia_CCMP2878 / gene_product=hypothetical protein / transcript_product=hypothetical protein / location=Cvel_scaffold1936:22723-24542(+) / protein_length=282 / sequence_SO=supercontig / SO=protein_coding / is_pseudo=false
MSRHGRPQFAQDTVKRHVQRTREMLDSIPRRAPTKKLSSFASCSSTRKKISVARKQDEKVRPPISLVLLDDSRVPLTAGSGGRSYSHAERVLNFCRAGAALVGGAEPPLDGATDDAARRGMLQPTIRSHSRTERRGPLQARIRHLQGRMGKVLMKKLTQSASASEGKRSTSWQIETAREAMTRSCERCVEEALVKGGEDEDLHSSLEPQSLWRDIESLFSPHPHGESVAETRSKHFVAEDHLRRTVQGSLQTELGETLQKPKRQGSDGVVPSANNIDRPVNR